MHIGVFDSGIGGMTVLAKLVARFPHAGFTYLGDTAHVPYGSKSPQVIRRLCTQALATLPHQGQRLDALVVACNTASSVALEDIRMFMRDVPVLSVLEPGAQAAFESLQDTRARRVLLLATRATLASGAYQRRLAALMPAARVSEVACPLFVPMIEEGLSRGPLARSIADHYLARYRDVRGVALLACTHYPWIIKLIREALPKCAVIDSASAVAARLAVVLPGAAGKKRGRSQVEWHFTDPHALSSFARAKIARF